MKHKHNCKETIAFILKHNTHQSSFPNYTVFTFYYYSSNNTLIFEVKIMKKEFVNKEEYFENSNNILFFILIKHTRVKVKVKNTWEKGEICFPDFWPAHLHTVSQTALEVTVLAGPVPLQLQEARCSFHLVPVKGNPSPWDMGSVCFTSGREDLGTRIAKC